MDVFVARQPIFDISKNVFAYELLFRTSMENFYDVRVGHDEAASRTISHSFSVIGFDTLTKNRRAFINFTKNLLLEGVPSLLPKEMVVVELLEDIEVDDAVVQACRRLKALGYVIALDDFIFTENVKPLIEIADIIKIDFLQTTGDERKTVMARVGNDHIRYLAEKVETAEDFQSAVDMGYVYFQGYFFSKPVVIHGSDVPGNKLNLMKIIHEVNRPDVEFKKVENIIKHDVSLSYKLLRLMNSAFFGFVSNIESIRHALVLLGVKEIRKWVSLLALSGLAVDKPEEILTSSVLRAKFCELLSGRVGLGARDADCFLMGMFSLIDALVDKPMSEILTDLPLAGDVKDALMGGQNNLYDVLHLVTAYERGEWDDIASRAGRLALAEEALPNLYMQSVQWANKAL